MSSLPNHALQAMQARSGCSHLRAARLGVAPGGTARGADSSDARMGHARAREWTVAQSFKAWDGQWATVESDRALVEFRSNTYDTATLPCDEQSPHSNRLLSSAEIETGTAASKTSSGSYALVGIKSQLRTVAVAREGSCLRAGRSGTLLHIRQPAYCLAHQMALAGLPAP